MRFFFFDVCDNIQVIKQFYNDLAESVPFEKIIIKYKTYGNGKKYIFLSWFYNDSAFYEF